MTGRALTLSITVTAVACLIVGRCSAPAPKGLPARVQAAVTRHEVLSVVDTEAVNRLEREKSAARQGELAAERRRRAAEDSAAANGRRADSLEAAAKMAQTSADSAAAWQQAYYVRSGEVEDLHLALHDAGAELTAVRARASAADSMGSVWRSHALRGDSVIVTLIPLAEAAGDRCRILWVVGCPSRKTAVVVGAIAGGAVVAIVKGKMRIRLPIG